ncbi:PTS glucose transporter subunit IIA [Halolactibacillus alkaliphilus]|uniref:PTS glucose transporter subunit IIA n=1 Tax=Halolactibacillus alkaliphilus TaxID=442899 RepID=A0A511X247_9BACI|nr:PTS glucose transporter subunit IIA [Halolactibacillus alkaliphilus]GEN57017.1 PTS glucose transporter subunit IIA [Halolactibacillus alkaliphilus]GGN71729.1 PTS glucose transporter subunit IIA [Halolactibacillus alkaliphilus]SFO85253.1 PTS system IIA component, Glc family [Halolactibacillus alkaliphilus]
MFKKLFGKEEKVDKEVLVSPMTGEVVDVTEVPDPTFSEKMMGDGIAFKPSDGAVVSPVAGEVVNLFPTKHAIGIKSKAGVEYLIHIGLDTVMLDGEGFTAHVSQGDKVEVGDPLVTFDLDFVSQKAKTITPLVITSDVGSIEKNINKTVVKGETEILTVHL